MAPKARPWFCAAALFLLTASHGHGALAARDLAAAEPMAEERELAVSPASVARHNAAGASTWIAGESAFFDGMTLSEARGLMGTKVGAGAHLAARTRTFPEVADSDIPDTFDARAEWPDFIHPIRNQGRCGSCWAFGAVESLSDRFAIASNGSVDVILSPEDLVSCDEFCLGCRGCLVNLAWDYLEAYGAVTEECFPYTAGFNGNAPDCPIPGQCVDRQQAYKKYRAKSSYRLASVEDIQKTVMTGGPVEAGFEVHQSFMAYKSGVYQRDWWDFTDPLLGGHAVKIVGWGTEGGTDYWLIANSWGPEWGLKGYFKIKRGVNECLIEETVYGGEPDLS